MFETWFRRSTKGTPTSTERLLLKPLQMPSELHKPLESSTKQVLNQLFWRRLRENGCHNIGVTFEDESFKLYTLASMLFPESHIVEIGSCTGASTKFLLAGAYLSTSHLHCIDPFEPYGLFETEQADKDPRLQEYLRLVLGTNNHGRKELFEYLLVSCFGPESPIMDYIQLHQDTSENVSKTWDSSQGIDLLFIDGDHTKCRQDVSLWLPHMQPWGAIVLHDVGVGSLYGVDSPDNTLATMLQEGEWKFVFRTEPGQHIAGISRDPEFWRVRYQDYSDTYEPWRSRGDSGSSNRREEPIGDGCTTGTSDSPGVGTDIPSQYADQRGRYR